jgi:hypothetical protein
MPDLEGCIYNTRLPGAVPQPLFLILIVFGALSSLGRLPFSKNEVSFL